MNFLRYSFLIVCMASLGGCLTRGSSTSFADNPYTISGVENQQALDTYLKKVLKQRDDTEIEGEKGRRYVEEAVRLDLLKAARSKGYYNSEVLLRQDNETGVYEIVAGEAVRISTIKFEPEKYQKFQKNLILKVGDKLDATLVFQDQKNLYRAIQKESCSFNLKVEHKVLLKRETNGAALTYHIAEGKKASLGAVTFKGSDSVEQEYLENYVPWKQGDCFRHTQVQKLKSDVLKTGLFEKGTAVFPDDASKGGEIPVEINLTDRAHRSLRMGLSYYTDEGPGAIFGWEHRNFFGHAEKINADLTLSSLEQSLEARMKKPFFLRKDQSLALGARMGRSNNDAYTELNIGTDISVTRQLNKRVSMSVGSDFMLSRIEEEAEDSDDNYALIAPFSTVTYDSRDNPLDPHKGFLLKGLIQPFFDVFGQADPFLKTKVSAQSYIEAHERVVLAGRVAVGSIMGAGTGSLPATERFYAGGGGSVRGFGYQEVGPYEDGDPSGGRSLVEASVEARFKVTDTIGVVGFVDAGQVDEKISPSFDSLSVGAGIGFRYYTDFGPLRLDIGTPISGDENAEDNFQLYISIGQAF